MFVLVVVDEATRLTSTQAIRSKSDVPLALESVFADLARHPILEQIKIGEHTTVHTDSEVVLQSAALAKALANRRVSLRASPPYAHERNGIAERAVQTIFDVTRALLQQADMPNNMWPVALHHATYLRNNAPSQALGGAQPNADAGCASDTSVCSLRNDISGSHRIVVKNPKRWDVVDSVHIQVHERELGMPAVQLANERRLAAESSAPAAPVVVAVPATVATPASTARAAVASIETCDIPGSRSLTG